MKKFISAVVLAFVSQTAHAALNPVLLQQIANRMVADVIQNDDLVQSLKGQFNTSQTNLENDIAAVETVGTTRNVPWAVGVESKATTNGSYRAVKRASRYGVEATAVATVFTPALAAVRYAAQESNKDVLDGPFAAETKGVLVQLETARTLSEVAGLLKQLNQVGKHALDKSVADFRAEVVNEETNGGYIDPMSTEPRTNCQYNAVVGDGATRYFNYDAYSACTDRKKAQLDASEMAKVVQDSMTIVFDGQSITITTNDAGGVFEAMPSRDRESIQKFENRIAKVIITNTSVTASAQAFVGVRKHEFERLDKEFKDALNRYQAQDSQTIATVDQDLRRILRDVKAFIRNQHRAR